MTGFPPVVPVTFSVPDPETAPWKVTELVFEVPICTVGLLPSGKLHALLNVPPPFPVMVMATLLKTMLLQACVTLELLAKVNVPLL
jgi:hypothetical protein